MSTNRQTPHSPRRRRASALAEALTLVAASLIFPSPAQAAAPSSSLHQTIRDVQRKIVKIYGAGGVKGLEAYQTGILISPDGLVLTVESYVLDTDDLAVVLDDGRKFKAEQLGVDPVRELALLKLPIEGEALPAFDLAAATTAEVGDRVLAASNLFNIAGGDEPVSVLQGVVTAVAPLDARRGAFEASYRGNVYIVDAAANNPGAAGGALVNWRGELLGLLGKELRSRTTNAWLNYALPVDQFIASVEQMRSGQSVKPDESTAKPTEPLSLAELGLVLVPDVLPRTPPYVDSVLPKSAAARAGLKADDLVVFVEGEPTASCDAVVAAIGRREKFDAVRLSVLRDGKLIETSLEAEDAAGETKASAEPSSREGEAPAEPQASSNTEQDKPSASDSNKPAEDAPSDDSEK
jgi:serine protease Do